MTDRVPGWSRIGSGAAIVSTGLCFGCAIVLPPDRKFTCEECDKSVERELREREERNLNESIERQLKLSGLPVVYRYERRREHLLERMRALAVQVDAELTMQGNVYLCGSAGIGKTSVGCVLLAEAIVQKSILTPRERGEGRVVRPFEGRYITTPDLFADLYAAYGGNGRSGLDVIEPLVDADGLVLDDIGKEKPTDHAAQVFFQLLDARYRRRRPGRWTLVLSNFDPDALIDRFGTRENAEPIARRLTEGAVIRKGKAS